MEATIVVITKKLLLVFILMAICTNVFGDSFRSSMIKGYKKECIKVNTENGLDSEKVIALCDCEAKVMDENFTTFSMMMLSIRGLVRDKPSEAELRDIRRMLSDCATHGE